MRDAGFFVIVYLIAVGCLVVGLLVLIVFTCLLLVINSVVIFTFYLFGGFNYTWNFTFGCFGGLWL